MKIYTIASDAAGQRLDRYLTKLFPKAGKAFLQKMLRKKNIVLNGKKAEANAILSEQDTVQVWFSDETIAKFSGGESRRKSVPPEIQRVFQHPVYEDADILVVNKPAGLLTQPGESNAPALSDHLAEIIDNPSATFHLAPANRLDRNTSGIVLIPKNYETQKAVLAAIRERRIIKEYLTLVSGDVSGSAVFEDHLTKNEQNRVRVADAAAGSVRAKLAITPLARHHGTTLLKVRLYTGRTHQIRAQLSARGLPIIGDPKYGDRTVNQLYQKKYDLTGQLLHGFHYAIPERDWDLTAPVPEKFGNILRDLSYTEAEINGILA